MAQIDSFVWNLIERVVESNLTFFCKKENNEEFDPGSGRTLAACLTHASQGEIPLRRDVNRRTGE